MKAFGIVGTKLANSMIVRLLSEDGYAPTTGEYRDFPLATRALTNYCKKAGLEFHWEDESNLHFVNAAKENYERNFNCSFEGRCD